MKSIRRLLAQVEAERKSRDAAKLKEVEERKEKSLKANTENIEKGAEYIGKLHHKQTQQTQNFTLKIVNIEEKGGKPFYTVKITQEVTRTKKIVKSSTFTGTFNQDGFIELLTLESDTQITSLWRIIYKDGYSLFLNSEQPDSIDVVAYTKNSVISSYLSGEFVK